MSDTRINFLRLIRRPGAMRVGSAAPEYFPRRDFELVSAAAMPARTLRTARELSHATWLLRRTKDGRYLAVIDTAGRLKPLGRCDRCPRLDQRVAAGTSSHVLRELGITRAHAQSLGLPEHTEPARLVLAGRDRYQRPLWLLEPVARAWRALQAAARLDSVDIDAISGFRGVEYQAGIFRRKLARGLSLTQILRVNAAPGYSEHHSGRAIDIGTHGEPAAETSFERTPAFHWLRANAHRFGFTLSYPRDNPSGIQYEPWHWCWHPRRQPQHVRT